MKMKTEMHKVLAVVMPFLLLTSCVFSTYVDISPNGTGVPLERDEDVLSSGFRKSLVEHIRKNTFYDAVTVVKDGKVIFEYGDTDLPMNCASARKSIYSMLYGIAVDRGIVDIDRTLAEYGIDDSRQPLTEMEKSATLRQLMQARSGIYLKALGESQGMVDRKPERGTYRPGEHFYYNNFDFNLLPVFLERITGRTVGELVYEWLAVPTGMTHFKSGDVTYQYADYTDYPQTRLFMSCEDLARAGMLMLNYGEWDGNRIISREWTEISTTPVSASPEDSDLDGYIADAYGYMWWVDRRNGTFWANGAYGQFMIVDRRNSIVLVVRNNSGLNAMGFMETQIKGEYEDEDSVQYIYELVADELNEGDGL